MNFFLAVVCRALAVEGRTPQERRATLLEELRALPPDPDSLAIRHLSWAMTWGVAMVFAAAALLPILPVIDVFTDHRPATDVAFLVIFTLFYLGCLQFVKALVAGHLIRDRWNPRSRIARTLMLAWPVDLGPAALLAAVTVFH